MTSRTHSDRVGEYVVVVGFPAGTTRPTAPFHAMAQLLDVFQQFDRDLAHSIHLTLDPVLTLTAVSGGSIRSRVATVVRSVDDEALKKGELKGVIGTYLHRAKHRFLTYLEKGPRVSSVDDLREVQGSLLGLAEETDVLCFPTYQPIPPRRLLMAARGIRASVSGLDDPADASVIIDAEVVPLRPNLAVDPILEAELLREREVSSEAEMILKIKRPDYLGDAMWDFRHGQTPIRARVEDQNWLESFRNRVVVLGPGDALRAKVLNHIVYDDTGNIVASNHTVLQVLEVLRSKPYRQPDLLPPEE